MPIVFIKKLLPDVSKYKTSVQSFPHINSGSYSQKRNAQFGNDRAKYFFSSKALKPINIGWIRIFCEPY